VKNEVFLSEWITPSYEVSSRVSLNMRRSYTITRLTGSTNSVYAEVKNKAKNANQEKKRRSKKSINSSQKGKSPGFQKVATSK